MANLTADNPSFDLLAEHVAALSFVSAHGIRITAMSAGRSAAACPTLDFTVKMTAPAKGVRLEAEGTALQTGSTTTVARADVVDVFAVSEAGERTLGATVVATGRVLGGKS